MSNQRNLLNPASREFYVYLEQSGALEVLTKALATLHHETDKPANASQYLIQKMMEFSNNDSVQRLVAENKDLKSRIVSLEHSLTEMAKEMEVLNYNLPSYVHQAANANLEMSS